MPARNTPLVIRVVMMPKTLAGLQASAGCNVRPVRYVPLGSIMLFLMATSCLVSERWLCIHSAASFSVSNLQK
jgi:hypothetical protein